MYLSISISKSLNLVSGKQMHIVSMEIVDV